ncbi:hypothetical protein GN956_G23048 [Arapaima gigas]
MVYINLPLTWPGLIVVSEISPNFHTGHETTMSCSHSDPEGKSTSDELDCKICYQKYNMHNRKPKILDCLHRVCVHCLKKILDIGDGSYSLCCPFCRHETEVTDREVAGLPDDSNILSRLATMDCWGSDCNEVVLTPKNLSPSPSQNSSNCLVITIMEVQQGVQQPLSRDDSSESHTERSLDSTSITSASEMDQDILSKLCNHVPKILVWLLGFLYFGSLPLGIYLLVVQKVTLGIVCLSLVPSSLTVCLMYGFCQCLCRGVCDCTSRHEWP